MHEEWAGGMKLKPTSAYGVRLYQNGSSLVMHYDKAIICTLKQTTTKILMNVLYLDRNPCNIIYRSY